jgi:hypothetical protein
MLKCEHIDEIQITKEEAEQLGERAMIDGIRLIIVDKLGEMFNKDCFAYLEKNGHKSCYSLNKLYCKNRECKFYRKDITISEIEKSIEMYAMKK